MSNRPLVRHESYVGGYDPILLQGLLQREVTREAAFFIKTSPVVATSRVKVAVKTYGGLDCAFNNAGIDGKLMVSMADYQKEVWDQVIATNLTGTFLCMKHEIPEMLKRGDGAIGNMSAVAGLRAGRSEYNY